MTCATCKYARLQRDARGRVMRRAGKCEYPIVLPALPAAVKLTRHEIAIWPQDGENCPTYEKN